GRPSGAEENDHPVTSRQSHFIATPKLGAIVASTLALLLGVASLPRAGRGQEAAGARPNTDLLRSIPFDRITLNDGTVLLVEPVGPRPLPPYDAAKELKRKQAFVPP